MCSATALPPGVEHFVDLEGIVSGRILVAGIVGYVTIAV